MRKYSLIRTDTKEVLGKTLFRIRAKISFGVVLKGELGGYIESPENLSDSGAAWVYGDAQVYGDARVSGDAQVYGNARVSGAAWVYGDADLLIVGQIGSRKATLTFTKSDKSAATGCFRGTIDEFAEAVVKTHGDSQYGKVYQAAIALAKVFFGI